LFGIPVPVVFLAVLILVAPADSGFLTVRSNLPGLALYLDGDYLGRAPLLQQPLAPGDHSLSIVSDDSLENVYWQLRTGRVGARLSAAWTLAAVNAGTHPVTIHPGQVTDVFIDYGRVISAPTEAKVLTCCGISGLLGVGAIVGFLVHLLFFRND
jgi:hypothetical protein